jgi:hypothetical protein
MADARAAACLAVLLDTADQISETSPRVGRWSAEEHRLYVSGVGRYGKRWSVIASHVGTRTGTQVRSHAVRTVAGREGHVPAPTLHPLGLGVLVGRPTCVAPPPAPSPAPARSPPRAPPPSLPRSLRLSLFPSLSHWPVHSLSPPLYSLSPSLSQQKINKKVAKQTNTETASTAAHGTRRKPRCCGRCRLHGVDVRAEGHQGVCPHVKCGCKPCVKLARTLSRRRER